MTRLVPLATVLILFGSANLGLGDEHADCRFPPPKTESGRAARLFNAIHERADLKALRSALASVRDKDRPDRAQIEAEALVYAMTSLNAKAVGALLKEGVRVTPEGHARTWRRLYIDLLLTHGVVCRVPDLGNRLRYAVAIVKLEKKDPTKLSSYNSEFIARLREANAKLVRLQRARVGILDQFLTGSGLPRSYQFPGPAGNMSVADVALANRDSALLKAAIEWNVPLFTDAGVGAKELLEACLARDAFAVRALLQAGANPRRVLKYERMRAGGLSPGCPPTGSVVDYVELADKRTLTTIHSISPFDRITYQSILGLLNSRVDEWPPYVARSGTGIAAATSAATKIRQRLLRLSGDPDLLLKEDFLQMGLGRMPAQTTGGAKPGPGRAKIGGKQKPPVHPYAPERYLSTLIANSRVRAIKPMMFSVTGKYQVVDFGTIPNVTGSRLVDSPILDESRPTDNKTWVKLKVVEFDSKYLHHVPGSTPARDAETGLILLQAHMQLAGRGGSTNRSGIKSDENETAAANYKLSGTMTIPVSEHNEARPAFPIVVVSILGHSCPNNPVVVSQGGVKKPLVRGANLFDRTAGPIEITMSFGDWFKQVGVHQPFGRDRRATVAVHLPAYFRFIAPSAWTLHHLSFEKLLDARLDWSNTGKPIRASYLALAGPMYRHYFSGALPSYHQRFQEIYLALWSVGALLDHHADVISSMDTSELRFTQTYLRALAHKYLLPRLEREARQVARFLHVGKAADLSKALLELLAKSVNERDSLISFVQDMRAYPSLRPNLRKRLDEFIRLAALGESDTPALIAKFQDQLEPIIAAEARRLSRLMIELGHYDY